MKLLKFSKANAKLKDLYNTAIGQQWCDGGRKIYLFNIPSGHTCPGAQDCLARVKLDENGKRYIEHGENQKYVCFMGTLENAFTSFFKLTRSNFDTLKSLKSTRSIVDHLEFYLPFDAGIVRVHGGGDFYNEKYFLAWLELAKNHPDVLFYAYTKSIPFWVKHRKIVKTLDNLVINASYGGRYDKMIGRYKLPHARVIFHPDKSKGYPVDHTDECAADPDVHRFCLLIHGKQRKGSEASLALKRLKNEEVKFSYSNKPLSPKALSAV